MDRETCNARLSSGIAYADDSILTRDNGCDGELGRGIDGLAYNGDLVGSLVSMENKVMVL